MRTCSLLVMFCGLGLAQRTPSNNLDFEQGAPGEVPPGWFVPKMLREAGYKAAITREGCRTGACVILTVPETRPPKTFGNLMNTIDGSPYRGKRIIFRAAVRVETGDPAASAAMWVRVDRTAGGLGFFDNMSDRPIRSGQWAFYDIRGTVDSDARWINYGVMVQGSARAWVDDASIQFLETQAEGPAVSAAREEISRLYAKIDAAYNTRDFEAIRSVATLDARVGSAMMMTPLEQAIRRLSSELGGASGLTYKTGIESLEVTGDEAKVRTRSSATLTKDGVTTTRDNRNSDRWIRINGAWRLKEALTVASAEILPPTDPETARRIASELKKQVVRLSTIEAGKPYDDLEAFGKAVGDARVVSLGEATHGTREIFQMKHRLLEYLVKEKGFTVFSIEANWPESEAADRYIKTGEGDPGAALGAMYFWTWQTEEVAAMVEWMGTFNKAPGKHPTLSFSSFDMQTYGVARDRVLAYVKQYAPQESAAAEAAYSSLFTLNPATQTDPHFDEASRKAESIVSLLESRRNELTVASSAALFRNAVQMSRIVAQATRMRGSTAGSSYRDEMMAKNIEWLMKEVYPNEKIVIWAHNGHISMAQGAGQHPMGYWLRASLGSQMYVLGFGIHTGTVRAVTIEQGRGIGLTESRIPQAEPGAGTAVLSGAGQRLFFLNLRDKTGALGEWLSKPHLFRSCGAVWDRDNPQSFMRSEALSKSYDGFIYLESTQAARGMQR